MHLQRQMGARILLIAFPPYFYNATAKAVHFYQAAERARASKRALAFDYFQILKMP